MKLIKDMYFPDDDEWMSNEYNSGKTTYETVNKALCFLTKTRICVTAGAHVGIYVKEFAKIFDHVAAFEPSKETYKCLRENTYKYHNVWPQLTALSNESGNSGVAHDTVHNGTTGGN